MNKVIHWELCKKFNFHHVNKWYMHNPTSVLENDTHKLLCDFDIQTDLLILTRRLNLIIINNKKNLQNFRLCCHADLREKLKRRMNSLTLQGNWKTVEHESDTYIKYNWCFRYSYQRIDKVTGGLRNKRTNGDHPKYRITDIGQNSEKSPGDLTRLVTQTSRKTIR